MPRVRVHQHVNPLSPFYRQEPQPIDVESTFAEPDHPLLLDIGSARGRFLLRMSEAEPMWNYLGVEIRHQLVDEANRIGAEEGRTNLHYEFCNAMLWLGRLVKEIPDGILQAVTIQFPDPWFKKRHAKRRMVNEEMVETIASHLTPNGRVFVQTDIESLGEEMFELFRNDARFTEIAIDANPFPVKTERERAVEDKGLPVYRAMFVQSARFIA
ncbi:MAG: tRNA (guanosine(46)-N7)-methyltransferase TrmB [Acidobacteria bacterium]|nr:MAG: tRNA (guanosine(46)-N7)-methyltransferase TrmB [Acidobacteriota bacterium]